MRRVTRLKEHLRDIPQRPRLLCTTPQNCQGDGEETRKLVKARIQGHAVPEKLRDTKGSAEAFLTNQVAKPSLAEKARTLVRAVQTGVLSTIHHDEGGYPYGSVVNLGTLPSGEIFTFISRLAEHTANVRADPRASVLVSQVQGAGDRLATARATLLGRFHEVDKTSERVQAFLEAHPAAYYVHFDDFHCFELDLERVRMISGFGEMGWISKEEFSQADVDFVSLSSKHAIDHMNIDHAGDLIALAQAFSGLPNPTAVTCLGIDRYGMELLCELPDGKRRARVAFPTKLNKSDELKDAVIALTRQAKAKLSSTPNNY